MDYLVSIIIPVYNVEKYIGYALESCLNQTYKNVEIICVDDGSSDGSAGIIRSAAEKDCRVKYFRQGNAGVSAARNTGLDNAQGDFIMFLDGDDRYHCQAVELLLNAAVGNNCDMVYASYKNTFRSDDPMEKINSPAYLPSSVKTFYTDGRDSLYFRVIWSKIYRAEILKSVRFNTSFAFGEDTLYILSLLAGKEYRIGFLNEPLYYYFQRESSAVHNDVFHGLQELRLYEECISLAKEKNDGFIAAVYVKILIGSALMKRSLLYGSYSAKELKTALKKIWKAYGKEFLKSPCTDKKTKLFYLASVYSKKFYEYVRIRLDPTLKDRCG